MQQSVVHYHKHNRQHRNTQQTAQEYDSLTKGDSSDIYVCLQIKIQLASHIKISWMKYRIVSLFMEYGCYINYVFFPHIQ